MERLILPDQLDDSLYQFAALVVRQLAQSRFAAQMCVFIGVTAGASQRTLFGDLNRKKRPVSAKNSTPCRENLRLRQMPSDAETWTQRLRWPFDEPQLQSRPANGGACTRYSKDRYAGGRLRTCVL